jgi:hypothetical protein
MRNEAVIRDEPGEYRISARYSDDGSFSVFGETVHPITLTVRVEDVWCRIPKSVRRYVYQAKVWIDGDASPSHVLEDVAPDARIFLDFRSAFRIEFS